MDGKQIREQQEYYVVKSNDLIQRARYNLTVQQQKLILFCISKIKSNDRPDTWYEFTIDEVCGVLNLRIDDTGFYYRSLKNDFLKLVNQSWVTFPDKSEGTFSWLSAVRVFPLSGNVKVQFNSAMTPYLFELRSRYTQYQLQEVLVFKNKYAIRLYELIRSYITKSDMQKIRDLEEKDITFSITELQELLDAPEYRRWVDFNRFVLKPAVEEINKLSDKIKIEYVARKGNSRNYETLWFTVSYPTRREQAIAKNEQRDRMRIREKTSGKKGSKHTETKEVQK